MNFDSLRFGDGKPGDQDDLHAFVTGQGRYTHDIELPRQCHAVFVRSMQAHGNILRIDTAAARAMPGVCGIFTAEDLEAAGLGGIPPIAVFNGRDGQPMHVAPIAVMARHKVCYVGEPVAIIVAETLGQAMDAAEAVTVEIDSLPALVSPQMACSPPPRAYMRPWAAISRWTGRMGQRRNPIRPLLRPITLSRSCLRIRPSQPAPSSHAQPLASGMRRPNATP